jgi:hypothetical protein
MERLVEDKKMPREWRGSRLKPVIAAVHESLHGTFRTCQPDRPMSALRGKPEVGIDEVIE